MTEFTNSECEGLIGQNVVLGLACFFGITANLILLGFSLKHGCGGLSPDKLLITNFAVADLIALMFSLPLHVRAINGSSDLKDNNICLARFFIMFTCFAVNITTLATIGIDRYDAICRAPIRKMTSRTTAHCIVFIWAFACFTAVAGGTGHILTVAHGQHVCARPEQVFNKIANTGKFVMLAVVTLWIVPSLGIIFNRFYGIASYVREYSSHLRTVLGTSGVRKEVKLTKICLVMIITYLSLWVTFAIMVILRNRFSSVSVHCAYLWAYSLAYCSFAVVPIEYMVLDRRLLIGVYQNCVRRPKSKVKPKESGYPIGRDGKATHTTNSQPNERPIQSTMHESPNRATKNINSSIAFQ